MWSSVFAKLHYGFMSINDSEALIMSLLAVPAASPALPCYTLLLVFFQQAVVQTRIHQNSNYQNFPE